ncbi:MAG: hypothetical protein SVU32_04125 [Candidatus Nanohaloarchaea archaeon]|nr:hypothetical protein [Candidatus Nanohaloarchaea archaeon]
MIDLDDLSDRKHVFRIIHQDTDTDGNSKVRVIDREDDSIDIMGALPGTCVWYSTGNTDRDQHSLKVVPWHQVISVENTVER